MSFTITPSKDDPCSAQTRPPPSTLLAAPIQEPEKRVRVVAQWMSSTLALRLECMVGVPLEDAHHLSAAAHARLAKGRRDVTLSPHLTLPALEAYIVEELFLPTLAVVVADGFTLVNDSGLPFPRLAVLVKS